MGTAAIPDCLGPNPAPSAPRLQLPPGSWDTHFHVLGPQAKFPYAAKRKYSPPDAPLDTCLAFHRRLGIERGLEVHANTHGFDNSVDLDAVADSGGRYLGVVRLDASVTPQDCERLHEQGIRGVRFAFNPQHGGTLDHTAFNRVLDCMRGLGWFIELHFDGAAIPGLEPWLTSLAVPVVIDHIGRIDVTAGLDQAPFRILCQLARRDNFWIKLSGADRLTRQGYPYDDVAPFMRRIAAVAPERTLWGSDWPHTGLFNPERVPDDGKLLDALASFVPDEAQRHRILVNNPERLLGLS